MNIKYLEHRELTDVIAFDLSKKKNLISAEVYISVDRVKENAGIFGNKISEEMRRVMIHGLLHLLGFGDKTINEKKQMTREENKNLQLFEELLKRNVSHETKRLDN